MVIQFCEVNNYNKVNMKKLITAIVFVLAGCIAMAQSPNNVSLPVTKQKAVPSKKQVII
jgi:starvation-inducible outer membrane lipoprotein